MVAQSFPRNSNKLLDVKIIRHEEISPGVFVVSLSRKFDFIPGQVVSIALKPDGPQRVYSIASGLFQEEIQLLYNVKPDGELTPQLCRLKPGSPVYMSQPFGSFTCAEEKAYWIASGTGIAPFISMLRSGLGIGKVLIHGNRTLEGFYFADEWIDTLDKDYIRCCSRERGEGIYPGRLTSFLHEQDSFPSDRKYYLCGLAEMVVDVREILLNKGIPWSNILAEIYF
ncbi:MAG: oxidoreductase [Bacteroidetes bacterium]|nr:oxidoreductase [Bacteroidota bacterium]